MIPLRQALVGLGANLGDRAATLKKALEQLRVIRGIEAVEASSIYETEPVGITDQPRFLNCVAGLDTDLSPEALLKSLQEIEQAFGRERNVRWGPRTLDLDLLACEGEVRSTDTLTLPHPRMWERAFVVVPLRELLNRDHFRRPAWDALRSRVAVRLPDESGVWPFTD